MDIVDVANSVSKFVVLGVGGSDDDIKAFWSFFSKSYNAHIKWNISFVTAIKKFQQSHEEFYQHFSFYQPDMNHIKPMD